MAFPDVTPAGPASEVAAAWILRAVPDGLWMLDDDGRTVYTNDRMAELLGIEPAATAGFPVFDALDEQGRADFRHHLEVRSRTGEAGHDLECRIRARDGSERWALVSHSPVRDDAGALRGWVYRVKDHTEQRALLEESRRRDLQFAEAQASARIGTWERELPSGRVLWSDEAYRICGVEPGSFEPTPAAFFELLHHDDREAAMVAYQAMLAGDGPLDLACRLADPGSRSWIRIRGFMVHDDHGEVVRAGGTLQDITAGRSHELGLEFLSALGGAANEARTLHEVLLAAEEHVQPHAQWPAVLVGAPTAPGAADLAFLDVDWRGYADDVRAFARELAADAVAAGRTLQRPGPDGLVLVAGPVVVRDRLACVVVADTMVASPADDADLTFFRQMLVILAHVAEREWAGDELATARDDALSASRAKSDFLATMSHEIRTPLNGVIGLSELLRRTELTPHQQRLAAGVDQAGRTLLALVNDILDLSKIEAGRLDLEEVDFDPRAVLEQSAGLVADRAREKGLELVVSSAADMPSLVRGDPVRFGQVVTNLAANAVKFTTEGEVVIRAHGEAAGGGSRVRVEVRDTGVGIAVDAQQRLFEAFTQADSSTTRQYGGTGLGLAISKRIVSAMSGDIGVRSRLGAGSTFWFDVSFDAPLGAHAREDRSRENAVTGLRVLVVDDNATNRFILAEQLAAWGVETTAVESAYDALVELDASIHADTPYDVVLLDYMMPGADGEQLARIVRAETRHDHTRLALLSSAMEPTPQWLSDAGIDSFLTKPVLPSRLLDVLATLGGRLVVASPSRVAPQDDAAPRGARVLVVEDNAINQLVAEGVLRRLGYDVVLADNGAAGVAAVADRPDGFAAILMDCQMPVMDGFDATRAVRAIQSGGVRTPIIAMTAAAVADERERCLDAGMDDFLTKPVDVALLGRVLDRWVSGREAPPAEVPEPAEVSEVAARLGEFLDEGIAPAHVARIVASFQGTSSTTVAALAAAAEAASADDVAARAHSLRGSAGNVGLTALADVARRIEVAARDGIVPDEALLRGLAETHARGVGELEAFVRSRLAEV